MISARSFSLVSARRITALLALLLSALCVTNAWQTLSVGRWHKPGAAIFPIALGALLAIYAIAIALSFEWFFVRLLKVQMPGGMFRQWLF